MRLSEWLDRSAVKRWEFAARIGVHPVTVSKWIAGVQRPRLEALRSIARETEGAVTANDFVDAVPGDLPEAA